MDSRLENRSADSASMVRNRGPLALSQTEKERAHGMKNSDRKALYLLKMQLTNHYIASTPKRIHVTAVCFEKIRYFMNFELPK